MKFDEAVKYIPLAKGSILICLILAFSYFYLSGGSHYIPQESLAALSFSKYAPQNIVFHTLIHTGLYHLLANLATLFLFALVVELALGALDVFIIFLVSEVLAAILFVYLNPNVAMVGASAGISGLLGAAMTANLKRALAAVLIAAVLVQFVLSPFLTITLANYAVGTGEKAITLDREVKDAEASGDLEKAEEKRTEFEGVVKEYGDFESGRQFEVQTSTDAWVHGYGAIFGILYVFIFRREKFRNSLELVHSFLGKRREIG